MTEPESRSLGRKIFGFLDRESIAGTRLSAIAISAALTAMPLAIVIAGNHHEIVSLAPIYLVAGLAALVAAIAAFALGKFLAPHVAGILCGVFGYGFFSLPLPRLGDTFSLFVIWVVGSLVGSTVMIWIASDSKLVLRSAAVATTTAALGLAVAIPLASNESDASSPGTALAFGDDEEFIRNPNVYIFVLDGFSNPAYIEGALAEFDVDFGPDIERLEEHGFRWEQDARSNYTETRLSLPSTLNTNFPVTPENPDLDQRFLGERAMRGHNATTTFFADAGYEYWHSGSGIWDEAWCDLAVADRCIGGASINLETHAAIWGNTPVRVLVEPDLTEAQTPESVVSLISQARALQTSDAPYYFFSHMVLPHQPFRFDRNCQQTSSRSTISIGNEAEFRGEYAEQALCAASQLANAMDELLAEDPTAVVILQADHGSAFSFGRDAGLDENIRERLGIFRMTRLPDDCRHEGLAAQSLINTLPLLRSCMTGAEPEFVEPRLIFTYTEDPNAYEVVHPDDQASG